MKNPVKKTRTTNPVGRSTRVDSAVVWSRKCFFSHWLTVRTFSWDLDRTQWTGWLAPGFRPIWLRKSWRVAQSPHHPLCLVPWIDTSPFWCSITGKPKKLKEGATSISFSTSFYLSFSLLLSLLGSALSRGRWSVSIWGSWVLGNCTGTAVSRKSGCLIMHPRMKL